MEEGQIVANWAQLIEDGINIVIPINHYSLESDPRSLIPFIEGIKFGRPKYGMVNKLGEIIFPPKYDYIDQIGEWIKFGIYSPHGFARKDGTVQIYERYKYGIATAQGELVLEPIFRTLIISEDLFVVQHADNDRWAVFDTEGNEIIPYGKYSYIDGFDYGLARVKVGEKWGIINKRGEEVLPVEYDNIWNFLGKGRFSTKVVMDGESHEVFFHDLNPSLPVRGQRSSSRSYDGDYDYNDNWGNDDGIDYEEETWYALTDGQYGDYPGPGVDYDILGF